MLLYEIWHTFISPNLVALYCELETLQEDYYDLIYNKFNSYLEKLETGFMR
jgi:hypothetical protein